MGSSYAKLDPSASLTSSDSPHPPAICSILASHRLMETPVEFPCGVVPYGVVGLTLPLVSVKLTGMWVPTTFLRDVLGVLNL